MACAILAVLLGAAVWAEHTSNVRRAQVQRLRDREVTSCAENAVAFETASHRIGLVTCQGTAGLPETPSVSMHVGERASIVGLAGLATITESSDRFLAIDHFSLTAVGVGTTVITVHDYPCWSRGESPQPSTCNLVTVVTTG